MNAGIGWSASYHWHGPSFIGRYVFPEGELVPVSASLAAVECSGLEVRDVESLPEYYAQTLHDRVRRSEAHSEEAQQSTDDTTSESGCFVWRGDSPGAPRFPSPIIILAARFSYREATNKPARPSSAGHNWEKFPCGRPLRRGICPEQAHCVE